RAACALSASLGLQLPMGWVEADAGQGYAPGVWHIPAADTLHRDAVAWAAAAFANGVAAGCHIVPLLRGDDAEPEEQTRMLDTFGAVVSTDGTVLADDAKGNQSSTQNACETEVNSGDVLQILARWEAAQTTPSSAEPVGQGRILDTFGTELSADGNLEADGAQVSIDDSQLVDGGQQSFKADGARVSIDNSPLVDGGQHSCKGNQGSTHYSHLTEVSEVDVMQDLARRAVHRQWWRARHEIADEWIFEIALAADWAKQDSIGPCAQPLHRSLAMTRPSAHKHPLLQGWVGHRTNRMGVGLQTWGHSAPMWGEGFFVNDMCPFGHRHFADDSLVVDDVLQKMGAARADHSDLVLDREAACMAADEG
ncbi:unnamed protein product, partial [Prorocentrum cordatum]